MLTAVRTALLPLFVLSVSFPASVIAEEAETFRLEYQFEIGDVVRYSEQQNAVVLTKKGGASEKTKQQSITEKHFKVLDVSDSGEARLQLTIDRTVMAASFNGAEPLRFDSESEETVPAVYESVAKTIGKPLAEITVRPDGTYVSGHALLTEDEIKSIGSGETGGDAISRNILIPLPTDAIQIGDDWDEQYQVSVSVGKNLSKNIKCIRKFQLKSVDNNIATIQMRTALLTPVRDPAILMQLVQRLPAGTIEFDLEQGQIIKRELDSDRTEFGWSGSDSSIRAVTRRVETLVTDHRPDSANQSNG
ncbi:hypothetical protein [Calycomorphotria hydatis]|uniref:Secreted protein n=1 Tax=Calycomorphotria hydatis TaxID=2528027 RepID=A0A517T9Q9_9PLAN|nr:hypothetical protein [Calycomorphotria hydatis]QDT65112.1 hypothetical protein V22_23580 [Calycomorphotria hydatis]